VLLLANPVRDYAWGAADGLARLLGTEPTGGPEAELWVGAHPGSPSRLPDGRPLGQEVEADPQAVLGPAVVERYGPRLPFLLKILAIGGPLSIQLHPSPEQARAGWDREEEAGIPLDAPTRTYRDPYAKPEVLVALEPTWVLTGFRTGAAAAAALGALDDPAVAALADRVRAEPDARLALEALLAATGEAAGALADAAARAGGVAPAVEGSDDRPGPAPADPGSAADPVAAWTRRLAAAFPGDPTALAPCVLELRRLEPGEGVFLPAGVPHAYLEGAGVELMAASDNVVRGGLTPKHVDRAELARLLAPAGTGVALLPGDGEEGGAVAYRPPVPEIALRRVDLDGDPVPAPVAGPGPALVLATEGEVTVSAGAEAVTLGAGRAVLVPAAQRDGCRLAGRGTAWWATVGSDPSAS